MSATGLLLELHAAGVRVRVDGRDLHLAGRKGALTDDLRARVAQNKKDLVAHLQGAPIPKGFGVPHVAHVPLTNTSLASASAGQDGNEPLACTSRATCGTGGVACVAMDFETRSLACLPRVGGRVYAADPSTEVLCAVFVLPGGDVVEWTPGMGLDGRITAAIESGLPVAAHNANGFDRFIWARLRWPEPSTWIDTIGLARSLGLPAGLEALGHLLLDVAKDDAGRAFTLALSRPDKLGKLRPLARFELERVVRYCRLDALILRGIIDGHLASAIDAEPKLRTLDAVINDRGFRFDADLARAVVACESVVVSSARRGTGVDASTVKSSVKLRATLRSMGVEVTDVRRETLLEVADRDDLPEEASRIIEARMASSGITSHKLSAALRRLSPDGRLRDTLRYFGAHTGRWSGSGFQPQNLPKGLPVDPADLDEAIRAALARDVGTLTAIASCYGGRIHELLASLVRACITATSGRLLSVVDYAAIEARVLAWLAGDDATLKRYRDSNFDPYRTLAARLFGGSERDVTKAQRNLGKALILGSGYGMGHERFADYAETFGVDWANVSIDARRAVDTWRDANPAIAGYRDGKRRARQGGLWQRMEARAIDTVRTGDRNPLGWGAWESEGPHLVCVLPSGRRLYYRNARVERVLTTWGEARPSLTYDHGPQRVRTYGGKLVENVTQAVARDLLAAALVALDDAGFQVVLHVHDEIVAEVANETECVEMQRVMCTPPPWAASLPLNASATLTWRYGK